MNNSFIREKSDTPLLCGGVVNRQVMGLYPSFCGFERMTVWQFEVEPVPKLGWFWNRLSKSGLKPTFPLKEALIYSIENAPTTLA
jgi:hypothetical protein